MAGRPHVLEETTLGQLRGVRFEVAVLPWGATEPHNLHLPFGTDSLEARSVAVESAGLAWERGARVIVLPTVPFGVNVQQLGIPLTLNMNPSTQAALLADREGWAWAPRRWTEVTEDSGVGDPRRASSERGAEFLRGGDPVRGGLPGRARRGGPRRSVRGGPSGVAPRTSADIG